MTFTTITSIADCLGIPESRDRVYTAAAPSTAAPSSVTVAGTSYNLATSSAAYALSDMGAFTIGDTVTLLLGQNGEAVGVMSASDINTTRYGVVVSTGTQKYTDSAGAVHSSNSVSVACTDGSKYQYSVNSSSFNTGNLVQIGYSGGTTSVSRLGSKTLSGKVNSAATSSVPMFSRGRADHGYHAKRVLCYLVPRPSGRSYH
jgi:hypothetical protein